MKKTRKASSRRMRNTTLMADRIIRLCAKEYPSSPGHALDAIAIAMIGTLGAVMGQDAADDLREHLVRFIKQRVILDSASGPIQ